MPTSKPNDPKLQMLAKEEHADCVRHFVALADELNGASGSDGRSGLPPQAKSAVTRSLHSLLVEPSRPLERRIEFDAIREALFEMDFRPSDFDHHQTALDSDLANAQAYPLIVAAIRADEPELVKMACDLLPFRQSDLYRRYATAPDSDLSRDLEHAINRYACNERVEADHIRSTVKATHRKLPRLVLHAGATKTGSTYIQSFLDANRPELLRRGVWVPEVGWFRQPGRPHKQAGHSRFTEAAVRHDAALKGYLWQGFQTAHSEVHTILLSSEAFFLHENSHLIPGYLGPFPSEVLIYLRRQDEWANSQYCELVGGGATKRVSETFEEWVRKPSVRKHMDYRNVLNRFASTVGKERVHVRLFERSSFPGGDIVADFSKALGLPELNDLPRPSDIEANDAQLGREHVEAMREFNARKFKSLEGYLRFVEQVTETLQTWRHDHGLPIASPDVVTESERRALMSEHAACNASIARDWLGRSDGELFGTTTPRGATETRPISAEEQEILELAYEEWKAFDPFDHVNRGSQAQRERRPGTHSRAVSNYGVFGWRRWGLTPIVRHYVRGLGTPHDVWLFDRDPSGFMHQLTSDRYRRLAKLLYPNSSVMGPRDVLRLWVPPIALCVRRIAGETEETRFRNDPVLFFRRQRNPAIRCLGRVIFPLGEVEDVWELKRMGNGKH